MTKKVTYNGIELSLPANDPTVVIVLDYLENVVFHLEEGLDKVRGEFQLSLNVDFSANRLPKYSISTIGTTNNGINEKVAKILERTNQGKYERITGSVKVDLLVKDK